MVWARIMINGRTRLHVVSNGTMTGQRYIHEVLLPYVRLFRGAVGDKFVFMDDNATCHRTLAVQDCLDSGGIQRLVWPARSPDLNPLKRSRKRKFGKAVESSANKKARREVSKKYGKFTENCIPDGVFPIGDDAFVFASTYYDSVSVQIRHFKKYGETYYPTPEGITLDPWWIEYIMRKKKVPESLEELPHKRNFPT
ncbi:transposable element Tcb2 transposase [Trichonephila clavipes]|nr:transposable element Tcb2 transposase [Trichonephila clavipes]